MIALAFDGLTVRSALPCQTDIFGHGPLCCEALRTRSPNAFGEWDRGRNMSLKASFMLVARPNGRPAMIAPPAKTSGYVASITEAIAPPAERPVTKPTRRSIGLSPSMR